MNKRLATIVRLLTIHLTLCAAIRYECDKVTGACGCGSQDVEIDERSDRLSEAAPSSWPMIVSVRHDCRGNGNPSTHCCAGTILNKRYVLAAARCFDPASNSSVLSRNITIAAGLHNLSGGYQSVRVVNRILAHPDWTTENEAAHNLVLLHLAEPLDLATNGLIRPACYPSGTDAAMEMNSNTSLLVAGWSVFEPVGGSRIDALQQLAIYPFDYNDPFCARSSGDSRLEFCAGRIGAACFPDVGAPAFRWAGNRWELVGVETYTIDGCLRTGYRGLFVRFSGYQAWVESVLSADDQQTSILPMTTTRPPATTPEQSLDRYECNRNMACGCGYTDAAFQSMRIAGGEDAVAHSWSMIVSLRFYGSVEHFCAGTLLSSSYVLTAAHCVDRFSAADPVNITVAAGITHQSDPDVYLRVVDRIYLHPNFRVTPVLLNDVAVLHMSRPLHFQHNPILAKTCVHRTNQSAGDVVQHPKDGTPLVMIGWGAKGPGSFAQSNYLRQIRVSAVGNEDPNCQQLITDGDVQFCAGMSANEGDACLGDAGGPVLYWTGLYWEQVGVIGQNFHCNRPGHPGVYTRLTNYWSWMEQILNATNEQVEPQIPFPTTTTSTTRTRPTGTTTRRTQTSTTTSPSTWPTATTSPGSWISTTTSSGSWPSTTTSSGSWPTATTSPGSWPTATTSPGSLATTTTSRGSLPTTSTSPGSWATTTTSSGSWPSTITASTAWPTTSTSPGSWATTTTSSGSWPSITTSPGSWLTTTTSSGSGPSRTTSGTWGLTSTSSDTWSTTTASSAWPSTPISSVSWPFASTTAGSSEGTITTTTAWATTTASSSTSIGQSTSSVVMPETTSKTDIPIIGTTTETSPVMAMTTTTSSAREKITYSCNRIPNECGCSIANVVLTRDSRRKLSPYDIGESAYPYSWSMIVSIRTNDAKHVCMGTILSDFFILTTAQCVINRGDITVAAGVYSLSQYPASRHAVAQVYVHESYTNDAAHLHDIAILRLEQPLELKAQPVFSTTCLPNSQPLDSTSNATIVSVGWDHSILPRSPSDALYQVQTKSVINFGRTCFDSTFNDVYQFCAGAKTNVANPCAGHFGEPIFIYRDNYWEQIGMLSHSHGCVPIGHSGVYTRLSGYTDWMQKIMRDTKIPMRRPANFNSATLPNRNTLILSALLSFVMIIFA